MISQALSKDKTQEGRQCEETTLGLETLLKNPLALLLFSALFQQLHPSHFHLL